MKILGEVRITPTGCICNDSVLPTTQQGDALLKELYRNQQTEYPKFYKMDKMCRLGFIASEVLLNNVEESRFTTREDRAVVLVSHNGCRSTDLHYQQTIAEGENYFPSPAIFVYTLPNIVTGEIAIRNKYLSETTMYIMSHEDPDKIMALVEDAFSDPDTTSAVAGWLDYTDENNYIAHLKLIEK